MQNSDQAEIQRMNPSGILGAQTEFVKLGPDGKNGLVCRRVERRFQRRVSSAP